MASPSAMPAERRIAGLLLASTAAALGLAGVYIAGVQPQAEGALLGVALGGFGVALILWARSLTSKGSVVGDRGSLAHDEDAAAVEERLEHPPAEPGRRGVLKLFWAA